jgi:hypothetical protein
VRANDVLADLVLDLRVGADERAHEVGAGDDADQPLLVVDHRQAVDALLDHRRRSLGDGTPRPDSQRGCGHRFAGRPGGDLQLEPGLRDREQPVEEALLALPAVALLEEDVALREDPEDAALAVDDGQTGDPVLGQQGSGVLEGRVRPNRQHASGHQILDFHFLDLLG